MTNLQVAIERVRAKYAGGRPLLSLMAKAHNITVRDFAAIFGISKSHAADILAHRKMPDLELAIRIARYWEETVELLFAWRVDDSGERRPLSVIDPLTDRAVKLVGKYRIGSVELALRLKGREDFADEEETEEKVDDIKDSGALLEQMEKALEECAELLNCAMERLGVCGEGDSNQRRADAEFPGGIDALQSARAALAAYHAQQQETGDRNG